MDKLVKMDPEVTRLESAIVELAGYVETDEEGKVKTNERGMAYFKGALAAAISSTWESGACPRLAFAFGSLINQSLYFGLDIAKAAEDLTGSEEEGGTEA